MIALWLAIGVAAAQDAAPAVSSDGLVPAVFSERGVVTSDSNTSRLAAVTVHVGWAHTPFVLRDDVDKAAIVRDDGVVSVSAGMGFGPLRLGATFAGYLATSDRFQGVRTAPGDLALDLHFVPFSARPKRPGFGLLVHATAPLGGDRLALGWGGAAWEARALMDGVAGPVWIGAEAGVRDVPSVQVGDATLDTSFVWRQATGVRLTRLGGLTLEWQGAVALLHAPRRETTPAEVLLSGWINADPGLSVRLGASAALSPGWTAPSVRAFAEIHGEFARRARVRE
jgi:hypothetical protein